MEVKQIKSKFLRNIFDQNTYVCTEGNSAVIIDAGAETEDVKAALGGKKVLGVLMTHLHFDHLWNIESYVAEFGADVFICPGAEEKFAQPEKNASNLLRHKMSFNVAQNHLKYYAGKSLKLENFDIEVFFTPGHSSDSVCLKIGGNLFTGDTVFADSIGRTDFYDSSTDEMTESLKLIEGLDFDIAWPGHYESAGEQQIKNVIKCFK